MALSLLSLSLLLSLLLPLLVSQTPHLQPGVRRQALLAQQPLRLAVELLDHLAREQARRLDLHPAADAEPHQAELERRSLVGGPARRRGEVPPGRFAFVGCL